MQIQFQPFTHSTDTGRLPEDSERLAIPELSDGFDRELSSLADGVAGSMTPVSYYSDRVPCGLYAIHISLTAVEEAEQIFSSPEENFCGISSP